MQKLENKKKYENILLLYIVSLLFTSCNFLSKNDEGVTRRREDYKSKIENSETKTFNYLSEQISFERGIDKDTVLLIAEEYYKQFRNFNFDNTTNKLELSLKVSTDSAHPLDFINKIQQGYGVERKKVFLVTKDLDMYFKLENLENIDGIYDDVEEIRGILSKN